MLLGEKKKPLPPNSLQRRKAAQRATETEVLQPAPSVPVAAAPAQTADPYWQPLPTPDNDDPNYISDDESVAPTNHRARRSKRILRQQRIDDQQQLHHIVIPDLEINRKRTVSRGLGYANEILQMEEWAYADLFAGSIIDNVTGESMEYRNLIKSDKHRAIWEHSLANEIGRVAQGIRNIKGTETIFFIPKSEIPKDRFRDVTYGKIVVSYRPQKTEKHRSRLTVGGDRINYPFDVSTPTSDLSTIKMLWNSVLSTPGSKFFGLDVANFYLGTPMERP